jgi:sugar phosphate permease
VIALVAQTARASLDAERIPGRSLSVAGVFAPLARVLTTPALRELALTGFIYAALQVCLMSFLVVYLTETLSYSLVAAGLALTVANLGGIVGRIVWGAVADAYVAPRALLGLIGVAAGAGSWATAAFGPGWPTEAMLAVCMVFGGTAIGWNGVQLSQVARNAPAGQVGAITGAAGFVTFAGVVVGPPIFALVSVLSGGYRLGFAVFGGVCIACGAWLLLKHRQ